MEPHGAGQAYDQVVRVCLAKTPVAGRVGKSGLACKPRLAYHWAVVDIYGAIADPTRRAILDELTERDGQTLFEICARLAVKHGLGSSRQAISQHLDVLETVGLVTTRREGRYKFHFVDTRPLRVIAERWPIKG
jgi:DNA-binding transcriptional ArsR family regulator